MSVARAARVLAALAVVPSLTVVGLTSPARATGITFISFDDAPAYGFFVDTSPLRGRYAAAKFSGPAATDGGAILDGSGGWMTPPRTGGRFLAFNSAVTYADGGVARGPETIKLPVRQKTVSIWVTQEGTETAKFKLVGKRDGRTITSTSVTTTTSDYVELRIHTAKGFDTLVLSAPVIPDGNWAADDLTMSN